MSVPPALPVPSTIVLGNGRQVDVIAPQLLQLDCAGVLYLLDGSTPAGGLVIAAWSPGAWDAVKAVGWAVES